MSDDSRIEITGDSIPFNSENEKPLDKRIKLSRDLLKGFLGISVLLMFIAIAIAVTNSSDNLNSTVLTQSSTQSEFDDTPSWDSSWVPAGYNAWPDDSNVAWKWASKNNCDNYGCLTVEIISQNGCPSGLYAALNWLDSNDSVVSYDNSSLPSLLPMQTAKLRFDDVQDLGKSGQMAEINCR